ncbi:hydrocephalus-inducing protein-like [Athalia rosae]|uniref:hydrocephalus-inducing protein-like n=1 Tax=Athalia rosae TaxID=37344 RepID=UPI002034217D|nr:hydrocephalus-inducing protein-like [Athalia rosae]
MLLTTEERTSNTIKQQSNNLCRDSCFLATPNIVIFQQFSPGNRYCVKLTLKNITTLPQYLKMTHTKDQWFTVEVRDIASWKGSKLAPGMSVVYDVNFFPDERRDYKFFAVFAMLVETFVVPILGNPS